MKKLIGLLLPFLLLSGFVSAEMQWFGLNPTAQSGNAGDSGQVTIPSAPTGKSAGSYDGFEVELKIVDSAVGTISDDSANGTWYTTCINTENVIAATGGIELIAITDTSTAEGHLFALGGDSTFVRYTVKTGNIPYDPDAQTLIYVDVSLNAVSGAATRDPLTFNTAVGDTLFKAYTWIEFTCWDSTLWGEKISGPYDSSGTPSGAETITATYTGKGELGRYHIMIHDKDAGSVDSIDWTHYGNQGHVTSSDTVAITGTAQLLDSGVSINFNASTAHTDGDVFVFHVSDSLHYGKTVKYKIRAWMNVNRR